MNKRNLIIVLIILLAIGFAAVSTTLFINGNLLFGTNEDDFTIIFTKAIVDDVDLSDTAISKDGKTITYETKELAIVGEESVLDFTVKNNSTQYDAKININCIGGESAGTYYELEYDLPDYVEAQAEIDGYVTARMIKSSVNEIIEELTCTLNVSAMERTEEAEVIEEKAIAWEDDDGDGMLSLGDIVTLGDETTASMEKFYVISSDETNTTMISMYNLYVGEESTNASGSWVKTSYTNPTGIQDSTMQGWVSTGVPYKGITSFSNSGFNYSGSIVEGYVNNYSEYLTNSLGIENTATIISKEEIESIVGRTLAANNYISTLGAPAFLYSSTYWIRTTDASSIVWYVRGDGFIYGDNTPEEYCIGVRPVIIISTSLI